MTTDPRPEPAAVLARLKDFQRATVEHVFRRLYLDADATRRYLIADEVGLGKTLVARGVIARAIDHLWDRTDRINVVYVCSNADIARQNIARLNVAGRKDFALSSRITLLPVTVQDLDRRRVNFISFTPGTSFDMASHAGWADERILLYWLLREPWALTPGRATRVLHGRTKIDRFRWRVDNYPRHRIHAGMAGQFAAAAAAAVDLRERFVSLAERLPRAPADIPEPLLRERRRLVADLRRLLAETCLRWLAPDIVVLDEFQRFKDLLAGDGDDATDAIRLAHHLFTYQDAQADPAAAARVLLLSATPYRMYTRTGEADDHHADFAATLGFLTGDKNALAGELRAYREALFRLPHGTTTDLTRAKAALEAALRRVMVRTERLALSADRNGMLVDKSPAPVPLEP